MQYASISPRSVASRCAADPPARAAGFRHDALFYAGDDGFLGAVVPFLEEGAEVGEPTLVVVDQRKIELLRTELGAQAEGIQFADMSLAGINPARIIPAWKRFVRTHGAAGRRLRGVGEPIWPGRDAHELAECHRHEALLNLAFADAEDFWLMCPYDTDRLEPAVVEEALRTHPHVSGPVGVRDSEHYDGLEAIAEPFARPLPEPPPDAQQFSFDMSTLAAVRSVTARCAARAGLDGVRRDDFVLATGEIASNSIKYGGGGSFTIWEEDGAIVCESRNRGHIEDPLVGRHEPRDGTRPGGYGVWLANQVCDLVQMRSLDEGTVVRLWMRK